MQEESEENSFKKPEAVTLSWILDNPHEREISKEEQKQQIRSINCDAQSTAELYIFINTRVTKEFHKPEEV